MNENYSLGRELSAFLRGLFRIGEALPVDVAIGAAGRQAMRMDPLRVPGSRHFASVLAYGNFIFADGNSIRCEAIPGISGVDTSEQVHILEDGHPQVHLRRLLTHFHFDSPSVLIEQHYAKPSVGTLTGANRGNAEALLPGKASFSQFIILTVEGHPLVNREPLVMTAERVVEWPPIHASFVSQAPTEFYELAHADDADARVFATLVACNVVVVGQIDMPAR